MAIPGFEHEIICNIFKRYKYELIIILWKIYALLSYYFLEIFGLNVYEGPHFFNQIVQ